MENNIDWSTEEKVIDGDEVSIFYLDFPDGKRINLSSIIDDQIMEICEIYKDDLVFISVDEYTGKDLIGIYSIKQNKVIFPFIINDYDSEDKSGFILINCDEGRLATENILELDVNPDNDFVYLYSNGKSFQNEGIIEKKINQQLYILKDGNGNFKLYNSASEADNCIDYEDIIDYYENDDELVLNIKDDELNEVKIKLK